MTRVEQRICHYFDQRNDFENIEIDHEKLKMMIGQADSADRKQDRLNGEEKQGETEQEMWQMLVSEEL